jgi:hypothetical protein
VERVFIPSPGYTVATVDVRKGGHQILRSGDTLTNDREFPFLYADKKVYFPFLDMQMYWSLEGNLQFRLHLKENQVLKYLNHGSTHTEACFAAIPAGVMKRLASLTTRTDKSELMRMDKLYPVHANALQTANLAQNIFPTLGKIFDNQQTDSTIDDDKGSKEEQPRHKQELYDFA